MKYKLKRMFDICISLCLIIVLLPVCILVSIAVLFGFGLPIIFKQDRTGVNGEIFAIYKFRTMLNSTDKEGNLLSDDERLTSLGRFLRNTSLDELPELFNVLKGDMSLVGPRPLLVEYLDKYTSEQARRHEIRPGITGWAQVNGRNAISWERKFELDVWYVDNWSLWIDCKILLMTVTKVFKREGISSEQHATMEKFHGYNKNGVDIQ